MSDKNRISIKSTIFGGQMLAVAVLFAFGAAGTAFAGTITKTFEFGPGLALVRSNVRTFPVLCRKPVTVTVKIQTLGTAGAANLVPIRIELREPDTAPDQEGPLVEAKNITAKTIEQTVTLSGAFKDRGCSLPWRVRVEHANAGPAPFVTLGSIKVDFDSAIRNINFPQQYTSIGTGGSHVLTVNLGSTGGLEEGTIVLKGDWYHVFRNPLGADIVGPNPIKLKIALIDPSGAEVKTAEGYADRQSERDQGLPILKLIYQVTKCTPGQWKLKITNLDPDDNAWVKTIYETFTPGCP